MTNNKRLARLVILALLAGQTAFANAQSADEFKTDEYKTIGDNVLDVIGAAEAYAKGYTGKGVIVGVSDEPANFDNPEFNLKQNSERVNIANGGVYDWSDLNHGTHVSGIVAASKNGIGMHGVAFDAEIKSAATGINYKAGEFNYRDDIYDYYLEHPEIKIINNSWGTGVYLTNISEDDPDEYIILNDMKELITDPDAEDSVYDTFIQLKGAAQKDKLLVFAAGNVGHTMPALESMMAFFDDALSNNLITVTASNAAAFTKENEDFTVTSKAIVTFSNLAQFREDSVLTAPGININSANANFAADSNLDVRMHGTSMAAPIVSGVGALVQQAFPYLGGKQIGDVLLSTANNNIKSEDDFFVTVQEDQDEETKHKVNIFLVGKQKLFVDNIENKLKEYYESNEKILEVIYKIESEEDFLELERDVFENTPMEALFGQGMVDADKAVNGLGAINVRRLTHEDISGDYTVNGAKVDQALYSVDTQGYNSVWSNDIKEIRAGYIAENPLNGVESNLEFDDKDSDVKDLYDRWVYYSTNWLNNTPKDNNGEIVKDYIAEFNGKVTDSGLLGLHAGLLKKGDGILALTGDNTYQGSSVVSGGTLQIDGSVAGDAYSIENGIIAGKGTIKGDLINNGSVEAGSYGEVDTLNVGGKFEGKGKILVNTDGKSFNLISVTGSANIKDMQIAAGSSAAPGASGTFIQAGSFIGDNITNSEFSGLLNADIKIDSSNKQAKLKTVAYNNTKAYDDTFNAVNSLYGSLDETNKKEMHGLYALEKNEAKTALKEITGGMQLNLAHDIIQNRSIARAAAIQQQLEREDGLWILNRKDWGRIGGMHTHGYNLTVGKDIKADENDYVGVMFDYNRSSLSGNGDSGEYDGYTVGLYAGTKNRSNTVTGYISYGVQNNEVKRSLTKVNRVVESDYDSSVLGLGVSYAYDINYGEEEKWHISPYAALNMAHYKQDGFREKNSVFAQKTDSYNDNYADGELGLAFKREIKDGSCGFNAGYRRILTGETQETTVSFKNGSGDKRFKAASVGEAKDHLVLGAYIDQRLSEKWSATGRADYDWSNSGKEFSLAINCTYHF